MQDPDDTVVDVLEPGLRGPDDEIGRWAVPGAEALVAAGSALWLRSLVNAGMPAQAHQWLSAPRPGDLVFVNQARSQHPVHRVGVYRSVWTYCPLWPDGSREEVYQIETLDGRGITWTNCSLVRLPRDDAEYGEMLRG